MTVQPLAAYSGAPSYLADPQVDGGWICNIAGVVEIAKNSGTDRGRFLYREFQRAWRASEGSPEGVQQRERSCFQTAWSALMRRYGPAPSQGGTDA